jgi:hypothetical protein
VFQTFHNFSHYMLKIYVCGQDSAKFFFNAVFHNTVTITIFTGIDHEIYWG